MVFNRCGMKDALDYLSVFYQKIILVHLDKNRFSVYKVDDHEWDMVNKEITMSEWFHDFAMSPYCHPLNKKQFLEFSDIERLKSIEKPEILYYQKLINGEYHNVSCEIIPVGDGELYLMVKDLTKMLGD